MKKLVPQIWKVALGLLALFFITIIFSTSFGKGRGFDANPLQARPLEVSPLPAPTETPTRTPVLPESPPATPLPTNPPVEIVVRVEASSPTPAPDKPAGAEDLTGYLKANQATLLAVLSNQTDTEIAVKVSIPAVYNSNGLLANYTLQDIRLLGATSQISGTPSVPANNKSLSILLPAHSVNEYEITISFDGDNGPGPYTGEMIVATIDGQGKEIEEPSVLTFKIHQYQWVALDVRAWENFKAAWLPPLQALLEALAVIGIALAVIYLIPPIAQMFRRPGLSLEELSAPDDEKYSKQLTSLLQDELDRFQETEDGFGFSTTLVGQSPQANVNFSTKAQDNTYVKVILEILEFIFKRNMIRVTGQLQRSNANGVGLTLSIIDNRIGRIIGTQTFWELDYSGTQKLLTAPSDKQFDPYMLLIGPAATWIAFELSRYHHQKYQPLGTSNWSSHAKFMAAMYMFGLISQGTVKDAKHRTLDLLHGALSDDEHNPAAAVNLSRFEIEQLAEEASPQTRRFKYNLIENRLEAIIKSIEFALKKNEKKLGGNTLWNAAMYGLAVAYSLSAQENASEPINQKQSKAVKTLETLERTIKIANKPTLWQSFTFLFPWNRPEYPREDPYLHAAKCLRGLIGLDGGKEPNYDFDKSVSQNIAIAGYRVHYDLACYYSLAAAKLAGDKTECARYAEKGFFYLAQGLEMPGDLCNYAMTDTDLDFLRKRDLELFKKIANQHAATAQPVKKSSLAEVLVLLGKQADIRTEARLIEKGGTPAGRREIAEKTDGKLSVEEVKKWVRVAELKRIKNVGDEYAILLYDTGIESPQELKTRNPESLLDLLAAHNKEFNLVKILPTLKLVKQWIRSAKQMKDMVD